MVDMSMMVNTIGNFNRFPDYMRANEEFEAKKRQRQQEMLLMQQQAEQKRIEFENKTKKQKALEGITQDITQGGYSPQDMLGKMATATGDPSEYINYQTQLDLMKKRAEAGGIDGTAYMKDAERLRQSNPAMTLEQAYALSRGGMGQGMYYNPETGSVEPFEGYVQGTQNIEYGKSSGREGAKRDVEKTYALPQQEENAQQALDLIQRIKQHEGLSAVVGMPNPFGGQIPFTNRQMPGTPAADFSALFEQMGGKNFLQAYETLKGSGQITEIEGKKATDAIAALNTAQSEKQFMENLSILEDIVTKGIERKRAGINVLRSNETQENSGAIDYMEYFR